MLDDLDKLAKQFGGLTEEYSFYGGQVTLRYDVKNHVYYLITGDELVALDGVTNICHILDKSSVLVPWGCKMMGNKLLSLIKTEYQYDQYENFLTNEKELIELIRQSKSAHKDILEDAGNVGHVAHAWIEKYINASIASTAPIPVTINEPRALSCVQAALTWMNKHNVRWLGTERKVYSRRYQYAGTMDGWALVDSCKEPTCCKTVFKDRLSLVDWKSGNGLWPEFLLQTAAYQQAFEEETGQIIDDRWIVRLGKEDGKFFVWHVEGRENYEEDLSAFLSALDLSRDFATVKERVNEENSAISLAKKIAKKAAQEEANKIQCKKYPTYKGVRYPTCNGGNPCQACLKKYEERHGTAK